MSDLNKAILRVAKSNPNFAKLLQNELLKTSAKLYGAGRFWVRLDQITQWQEWVGYVDEENDRSDSYFEERPTARKTLWIARGKTWESLLPVATDNNLKIPNGRWRANVFGNDLDTNNEKKSGRVTFFRLSFGTGNAQGTPEESIRDRKAYMAWAHHLGAKLNRKDYAEKMEDIDYDISTETARVAQSNPEFRAALQAELGKTAEDTSGAKRKIQAALMDAFAQGVDNDPTYGVANATLKMTHIALRDVVKMIEPRGSKPKPKQDAKLIADTLTHYFYMLGKASIG